MAAPAGGTHFRCVQTTSLSLSHHSQVPGASTSPQEENAGRAAPMPWWLGVTGYTPVLAGGVNIIACVNMWYEDFGTSYRRTFRIFFFIVIIIIGIIVSIFLLFLLKVCNIADYLPY